MRGYWVIAACLCLTGAGRAQNSADELIQAIRNNDLAGLKAAFAKGADVNAHDGRDTTLLMHAAAVGSTEAVKLLLDSGADITAKNQFNDTALTFGADHAEKARMLIDKGADVNAVTKMGRTPLMIAAHCAGCASTVKLLLDKGANPKAKDGHSRTALLEAVDADALESVKLLMAKGAEADAADEAGNTPLMSAAMNCNLDLARLLLAQKANVNAATLYGGEVKFGKIQLVHLTPLMLASTFCPPAIVKTFLDAGAKVNDSDIRGMTPLMFAVSSEEQNPAVVKLLLGAGANANAKTTVGETALDWAEKFGSREVIAALTAAGAKEGVPYTAPERKPAGPRSAGQATEQATALLQKTSTEFFKQSGCVGCHHQPVAMIATDAARRAGVKVDEGAAKGHVKMAEGQATFFQQVLTERVDTGGAQDTWIYELLAMSTERYPASRITDTLVSYIASTQRQDGSWFLGGISRAPLEEGHIARTALGLRALQLYSTPGMKSDLDSHIARARDYLLKAKSKTNDEAAMQIAGLHWAGGNDVKVSALAKALVAAQHADGGWSQNRNLGSDAYATGETLWALHEAGALKASDAAYQKGAKFLLDTQWADGSWYVRSRAPKFQPYFQSGFPFDHDQWISSSATAYAVRGLAPAVDLEKRASR
jgi:ankyrin repeat protein